MKCLICERFSLLHICKDCQSKLLTPSIHIRYLQDGTKVYSFYKYDDIKELLFTKHTDLGFHIFNILAKLSFKKFAHEFSTNDKFVSIGIDDTITSGYSHTAILNKHLKSYNIKPLFNKLRAKNIINYSGKTKKFRQNNKRDFKIEPFKEKNIILVDDIITTGTTLQEATLTLKEHNKNVVFCLTLCDAFQS